MSNPSINLLTEQQARQLIREELESFFQENLIDSQNDTPGSQVVDLNGLLEARPFVGSKSTIYKKAYQGLIPHSKRGKKLYFDLQEIDAWLLEHKVKTPDAKPYHFTGKKKR